ncbi:MAG: tetratricopeptide repeat protein [Planctomycetota bacterium]|jgi:tetratricopeptide (TPR) repeat protein
MRKAFRQHRELLICGFLVLGTLAAFWPVHGYKYVDYDDNHYVTENTYVKAGLTRDGFIWAFTTGHSANWHPLTWLSHMLDCELFGVSAGRGHVSSLILHIVSAIVLFGVLRKMTGALWASGFVAAVFAFHPLHVESVTWIAERKDVLSGLFWMLTLAAYLGYVRGGGAGWYAATLVVFGLGLMAKPMLVTLPFVLVLLDFWPLERFGRRSFGRLAAEKVPLFILSAVSSVVTFIVQQRGGAVVQVEAVPFWIRMGNAFVSYGVYIGKMIWPSGLAVFYPYAFGKSSIWPAVLAGVFFFGISICAVVSAARYRYLFTGWFWYVGTLVPVIGLLQVGTQARADRYTYLPSIGIAVVAAWGAAELSAKWRYRKIVLSVLAVFVVGGMLFCTRLQVRHWQDSFSLFKRAVEVTENNYIGHTGFGKALCARGRTDKGIGQYRLALKINPDYTVAHYNLGNALSERGEVEEAVRHYRAVLRAEPEHARAHNNLGNALSAQDKFEEAIGHYREALRIEPGFAKAYNNLGGALMMQGNFAEATRYFREALKLRPEDDNAWYNLGYALELQGKIDEAIRCYERALEINPKQVKAKNNLDAILAKERGDE